MEIRKEGKTWKGWGFAIA